MKRITTIIALAACLTGGGCAATGSFRNRIIGSATAETVLLEKEWFELKQTDPERAELELRRIFRLSKEEFRKWLLLSRPNTEFRDAIEQGKPALGMGWAELRAALGRAKQINTTVTAEGERQQLIFERGYVWRWTYYVYTLNNTVIGWKF